MGCITSSSLAFPFLFLIQVPALISGGLSLADFSGFFSYIYYSYLPFKIEWRDEQAGVNGKQIYELCLCIY